MSDIYLPKGGFASTAHDKPVEINKRLKDMGDGTYAEVVSAVLNSSSVEITGPVTVSNEVEVKNDTGNPVPVSGPLTDTQLRATAVPVSGPLTDTQLRATAVPVSGPLTDTQLRAASVPVIKGQQSATDCTIANGASLSGSVDLGVYRLVGISIPATFEPTTLSFQSSYDGSTWNNLYDGFGAEKTITVGVSRRVILSPADFYGVRYIKVRGGTAASPTTVAADRVIKLIAEA